MHRYIDKLDVQPVVVILLSAASADGITGVSTRVYVTLGIKVRASCALASTLPTELPPQPPFSVRFIWIQILLMLSRHPASNPWAQAILLLQPPKYVYSVPEPRGLYSGQLPQQCDRRGRRGSLK